MGCLALAVFIYRQIAATNREPQDSPQGTTGQPTASTGLTIGQPQGSQQLQIDANDNHFHVTQVTPNTHLNDNNSHSQVTMIMRIILNTRYLRSNNGHPFGSTFATQQEISGHCSKGMHEVIMRCPHGGNARDLSLM